MAIKAKVRMRGDEAEVKVLIKHPMETGQRKDRKTGKPIPAHFIQAVTCDWKGNEMIRAHWGPAISKNPYLSFKLNGPQSGDAVVIRWNDNMGGSGENEYTVK